MKGDVYPSQLLELVQPIKSREPGRPRAVPVELEPVVIELYRRGYGYRAIARILREEYHNNSHYSSVSIVVKRLACYPSISSSTTQGYYLISQNKL